MQKATNLEMNTEFKLFGDIWKLYKAYYHVQAKNHEKYWTEVLNAIEKLNHEYKSTLCKNLLLAVLDDLETRAKDLMTC